MGVEHWMKRWAYQATAFNQTPNTMTKAPRAIRRPWVTNYLGSQTAGDKLRGRKGNSPDRRLRSPNDAKWLRKSNCCDSQDVGLEAAII